MIPAMTETAPMAAVRAFCKAVVEAEALSAVNVAWARQDAPEPKAHAIVLDWTNQRSRARADYLTNDDVNHLWRQQTARVEIDCIGPHHLAMVEALENAGQYRALVTTHLDPVGIGWRGILGPATDLTGLKGTHKEGRSRIVAAVGWTSAKLPDGASAREAGFDSAVTIDDDATVYDGATVTLHPAPPGDGN